MSRTKRPINDIDPIQARLLYKKFSNDLFKSWSCNEINKLSDFSINLKFNPNNTICKRNEGVSWLGIIIEGTCLISIGNEKIGLISEGYTIGNLAVLQAKGGIEHIFDITAKSPGILSIFYIEDIMNIQKKIPELTVKILDLFGLKMLDCFQYQMQGRTVLEKNVLETTEYSTRRKQEFCGLNRVLEEFPEFDRIDIKILSSVFKVLHFKENKIIIKAGTIEDTVFFLVEGELGIPETKEYADIIFGVDNFLNPGMLWNFSIMGLSVGTAICMTRGDFMDIIEKYAWTGGKFLRLLTSCVCKNISYSKSAKFPAPVAMPQNYIELDPRKVIPQPNIAEAANESDEEPDQKNKLPPLYLFPMFETKQQGRYIKELNNSQKDFTKIPNLSMNSFAKSSKIIESPIKSNIKTTTSFGIDTNNMGKSIINLEKQGNLEEKRPDTPENLFLIDKAKKQRIEDMANRRGKRRQGSSSPNGRRSPLKKNVNHDITETFAEIARDLKKDEEENREIIKKIKLIEEENAELMRIIDSESMFVEEKDVRLKKNRVMKDIEKIRYKEENAPRVGKSFNSIISDQAKQNRVFYLAFKYSQKWIEFVRRKKLKNKNTII
ncbi:hypothetical protein SteCoe_5532 [Stentor coeruleus]|uniref:Cyclic nucleotide-binding domain-containing protein n=1 Tax=Stentor coeruleus TaxID=5963 RepID=A0A1R2CS62_9CILI|nr:hypothetical protein SteCoe_5532 [Stentor coeruleus]